MRRDMMVSRYAIPIVIPCIDGLSIGPLGFGVSKKKSVIKLKTRSLYS